jgi:hypothetical protein
MLLFTKGQTSEILVTLAEKIVEPTAYRFVFKGIEGNEITIRFTDADDLSTAKSRYNLFEVNTDMYFYTTGLYSYKVYDDNNRTLETGIMKLLPSEKFTMVEFEPEPTIFTIYDSQ